MLSLLQALKERRNNVREVWSKVIVEDSGHNTEEQETALSQPSTAELKTIEGLLHHVTEVRSEHVLSKRLSEGTNGIHGDTSELLLLSFASEDEEVLEAVHGGLEIGKETVTGSVSSTADSTNDDGLDTKRSTIKKTNEALHDQGQVLVNNVV